MGKNLNLSFLDVQTRLGLSPGMLFDALNEGKIRTNMQRQLDEYNNNHQYNLYEYAEIGEHCPQKDDFFTEENVENITIHEIDLQEALKNYPELDKSDDSVSDNAKISQILKGIPNYNNSIWLSVEDLKLRWKVDRFDIVSRLRSGELYSNIYDPNRLVYLPLVSPFDLYADETIHKVACNLHNHIWPYEEIHTDLKKIALLYYNDIARLYGKEEMSQDTTGDNVINTDPEWMPAHEVRVVIGMTPIQFVELLNTGYFETDREQERRDFARLNGWELEDVPFFKTRDLDTLRVHRLSFKENSSRFCSLKKSSPLLDYYGTSGAIPESVVDPRGQVIVELKSQNIQLQARIDDLENMLSTQAKSEQNGKPRTASATEAAKASRVEEWKGYAVVIAKVGYECGLEDRTQVTRSTYEKLAKRHGGLSKQALELLRDALPEGVTKKTGGPASQG